MGTSARVETVEENPDAEPARSVQSLSPQLSSMASIYRQSFVISP